ncbi:hypothetical protein [Mitsuaria sp. GD03876]|uniref:hypothetical protein n=1 Tax=Mitsuaria sp. GD03876 TaxID=2975399 RepID=UPI00244AC424|nr:hypothetical protein [Mitsuaria sp. GD03876]MDH0864174.1 hypothetical protein [Mitsuaria sp. GD03876]
MKFHLRTPSGQEIVDAVDDNVDILIDVEDGRLFSATFFTINNLSTLMRRYRASGECAAGKYVWAKDMIVVESITRATLEVAIDELIRTGEIESCCTRLH